MSDPTQEITSVLPSRFRRPSETDEHKGVTRGCGSSSVKCGPTGSPRGPKWCRGAIAIGVLSVLSVTAMSIPAGAERATTERANAATPQPISGTGSSFASPAINTWSHDVACRAVQPLGGLEHFELGHRSIRVHQPDDRLRRERHRVRGQHGHDAAQLPLQLHPHHRRWHCVHVPHSWTDQAAPAQQLHGVRLAHRGHQELERPDHRRRQSRRDAPQSCPSCP